MELRTLYPGLERHICWRIGMVVFQLHSLCPLAAIQDWLVVRNSSCIYPILPSLWTYDGDQRIWEQGEAGCCGQQKRRNWGTRHTTVLSHEERQFHGCGGMRPCAASHNAVATVPRLGLGPEGVLHTTYKGPLPWRWCRDAMRSPVTFTVAVHYLLHKSILFYS